MADAASWERFRRYYCAPPGLGLSLDVSRMNFGESFFAQMTPALRRAFDEMDALERGAIANADENRMVGHYWLRAPHRGPTPEIRHAIETTLTDIRRFTEAIHSGRTRPARRERFDRVLVIGIGGSALGPQLVSDALGGPRDAMSVFFCDNTDPDGIDRVLAKIGENVERTLTLVISKSGGTVETRNGMLEARARYEAAGLSFPAHAVAITGAGSALDQLASSQRWLHRFPMWDWVGGRTSELSAVGLVPAALQGLDIDALLAGAAACDEATRVHDVAANPAALLALMWHHAGQGRGAKDMVVLPYKDRLVLFSKYLQQLVMESLGKQRDRDGRVVHQGLAVYGNKGSTDQHAYVQQLRDGLNNFFVTFVQVLKDRQERSAEVEDGVTSGDYLLGFLLGTRHALHEADRESVLITLEDVTARSLGVLIALFERAVGLYASLINVNAYHQPGVEAGKKAATSVITLQQKLLAALRAEQGVPRTAESWAKLLEVSDNTELVYRILEHLAANADRGVTASAEGTPQTREYGWH